MNDLTKPKNTVGRPRTVTLPIEEMIALGEEMVAWVRQNNPIHIKQWYSLEKKIPFKSWDCYTQKEEFLPYYEEAMAHISINYINGEINPSIAQRFLRVYFKDLREEEDETKKLDSQLRKDVLKDTADFVVEVINYAKDTQKS